MDESSIKNTQQSEDLPVRTLGSDLRSDLATAGNKGKRIHEDLNQCETMMKLGIQAKKFHYSRTR